MGPGDLTPIPQETLAARVASLWQTIYGVSGNNGMHGDCKEMIKRIRKLEVAQARLAVIAGVGSGLVVLLGGYAVKALFGG